MSNFSFQFNRPVKDLWDVIREKAAETLTQYERERWLEPVTLKQTRGIELIVERPKEMNHVHVPANVERAIFRAVREVGFPISKIVIEERTA